MASSIEWLNGGETWNPIRARTKRASFMESGPAKVIPPGKKGWACVRISPGCQNCYSETQNVNCGTNRTRYGTGLPYNVPSLDRVEIYLDEETLLAPLHWKKGKLIFPCSMTDWMANFVPDEFRDKMLAVMALTPQHTYLTLTKRADRQRKYLSDDERAYAIGAAAGTFLDGDWIWNEGKQFRPKIDRLISLAHGQGEDDESQADHDLLPLPNLWLGTSAEDQQRADERIPEILNTPAVIRWVSVEPLLEPVNLRMIGAKPKYPIDSLTGAWAVKENLDAHYKQENRIHWIVVGGESGPGARPFNIEWARQIVAQCQAAHVPVFVKQLGSKPFLHKQESVNIDKPGLKFSMQSLEINSTFKLKDRKGGDMSEWPTDLQVRQYPEVAHARS